jgi:hypothetical protein
MKSQENLKLSYLLLLIGARRDILEDFQSTNSLENISFLAVSRDLTLKPERKLPVYFKQ